MNKKIMMSGLSIISALVLLGGTAFAAFSGQAAANSNTFSTGTGDLQISLDNSGYDTSVSNPFNHANIVPGYSEGFTFYLKNTSSGNVPLNLSTTFGGVVDSGGLLNELTSQITCTNLSTTAVTVGGTWSIASMNGGNVDLGSLAPGEVSQCVATFALPGSSTLEGTNVSFNAIFNGNQAL